jgi:predicted membrane channel-forming protein YqfA (hemolysin III family)
MELETLEMIKNAYGVVCIVIALTVVYMGMRGRYGNTQGMLTAFSAVGILGISGVIALSSDATKIDWLDDWIITVPLILLSFGFVRYDGKGFSGELNGWAWFAVITFLVIGSAQPFLTEIDTEPTIEFYFLLLIWIATFVFFAYEWWNDERELDGFEYAVFVVLAIYPLLVLLGAGTLNVMEDYTGSWLDEMGYSFYAYQAILVGLSVFCKIGLSVYHLMKVRG